MNRLIFLIGFLVFGSAWADNRCLEALTQGRQVLILDSLTQGAGSYRKFLRGLGGAERSQIERRIEKYKEDDYLGDFKPVTTSARLTETLYEIRIHVGPGIRIYFLRRPGQIVIVGFGFKDGQVQDIERAGTNAVQWLRDFPQEVSVLGGQ